MKAELEHRHSRFVVVYPKELKCAAFSYGNTKHENSASRGRCRVTDLVTHLTVY